jgi:C1A family cysteine protease
VATLPYGGMDWQRCLPDFRDYTPATDGVRDLLSRLQPANVSVSELAAKESLAQFFPAVDNQQCLNSSAAQACVDLVQYFERRALGRTIGLSKLFVYQSTKRLLGTNNNCATDLRSTFKAIVAFGIPAERHWPYDLDKVLEEPPAFLYAFADRYKGMRYVRLDARNGTGRKTLKTVKAFLSAGFPVVFGFAVPASISSDGDIPYRPTFDDIQGGQAVVAVGYDDRHISSTKGAIHFRNSWGREWGEQGYGWLPYAYVEEQLAVDFWTVVSDEWLHSDEFLSPTQVQLASHLF